jgi:hypothetical protein
VEDAAEKLLQEAHRILGITWGGNFAWGLKLGEL